MPKNNVVDKNFSVYQSYATLLMISNVTKNNGLGCYISDITDSEWRELIATLIIQRRQQQESGEKNE